KQRKMSSGGDGERLIPQGNAQVASGGNDVRVQRYMTRLRNSLLDGDRHDVRGLKRHHVSELPLRDQADRRGAESQGEKPVEGRRGAAALQVAEHHRASLLPGHLFDRMSHLVADAAEPVVLGVDEGDPAPFGARALRHDDDAEVTPLGFASPDLLDDLPDVEGDFRDQDDVGGPGEPRVERDEAGVAAHHFDHHDPVMAFGRGVHLVDGFGGGLDGRIESERRHGPADVVVDGFRDTDDGNAHPVELHGDAEGAVPADRDDGIDAQPLGLGDDVFRPVMLDDGPVLLHFFPMERVAAAGGAQDGAAEMRDAPDFRGSQGDDFVEAHEPVVAVADAEAFPATVSGGEHDTADDGVEARGVTATGGDGDLHVAGASRSNAMTSPGWACRPSAFLEKMVTPSRDTSNTPPDPGMSWSSASGNSRVISAAKLVARGS